MAKIKVNPEYLLIKSGEVLTESAAVGAVGSRLSSIASKAPSYDGQFGPVVRAIGADAVSRAKSVSANIDGLSTRLTNKAREFLMADSAFKAIYNKYRNSKITSFMYNALMSNKTFQAIIKSLSLGSLSNKKTYEWWMLLLYMWWIYTHPIKIKPAKKEKVVTTEKESVFKKYLKPEFYGIAEKVKKGTPNTSDLGYPRNGYGGVQSNCTWYVAQAVSTASGGKVILPSWGDAKNWVNNAKGYKVDAKPEVGSVIHFDFGHVGLIEKVEVKNGRTLVTWSEEQATGKRPSQDWGNVTQVKDQLRWRVTADLTNYLNKGSAKCIHIKYP